MKIEKTYKVADKKQPNKDKQKENKKPKKDFQKLLDKELESDIL